jgi:hypothetical protein
MPHTCDEDVPPATQQLDAKPRAASPMASAVRRLRSALEAGGDPGFYYAAHHYVLHILIFTEGKEKLDLEYV